MQAQKLENKKIREKEMATLKREMAARAKSERELKESEERLRQMQEAMENHQRELQEARDTIARLEAQLRETQVRGSISENSKLKLNWNYTKVFLLYYNFLSGST